MNSRYRWIAILLFLIYGIEFVAFSGFDYGNEIVKDCSSTMWAYKDVNDNICHALGSTILAYRLLISGLCDYSWLWLFLNKIQIWQYTINFKMVRLR